MSKKKVLIAASGTGGHLLPALYVAEELKAIDPSIEIEFCGSGRPLEEDIIGRRGYKINIIPIVGVSRRGWRGKLEFLLKLPKSVLITRKIFRNFKPNLVLGVGGYISVLPVLIAKFSGLKTIIHEAEIHPGLANNFLSYFANLATLANQGTQFKGKIPKVFTGQPLNPKLFQLDYSFSSKIQNILILGGSQGANQLDEALIDLAKVFAPKGINIKHQSRKQNIEKVKDAYQHNKLPAEVFSFSNEIPELYAWADLIIARSGLNTVRELEIVAKPVIFVPLPNAPEQQVNALRFSERFLAKVVKESSGLSNDILLALRELEVEIQDYLPTSNKVINGSSNVAKEIFKLLCD